MGARPPLSGEEARRRGLRFGVSAFAAASAVSISAANAAWGVLLLFLILETRARGRVPWPGRGPLAAPWAAYLGWVLAASALGVDPARSLKFLSKDFHKVWLFYLFAAALAVEPSPRSLRWLFSGWIAASLIGIHQVAAQYVYPGLLGPGHAWYHAFYRAHGTVHPVTYGELLVFALSGALAFWWRPDRRAGLPRPLLAAALLLGGAALVLSQTRGAWLGMLAACAVFLARLPWRRALAAALAAAAVAGGLLSPWSPVSGQLHLRLARMFDPSYPANATRIALWKTAVEMAKDRPATGVGLNNYNTMFPAYHGPVEGQVRWGAAHNVYLHQLAERGVPGLLILLWLLGAFWWTALKAELRRADAWSLWALAAATALLVMNLTQNAFQEAMVWMSFLFLWTWSRAVPPSAAEADPQ